MLLSPMILLKSLVLQGKVQFTIPYPKSLVQAMFQNLGFLEFRKVIWCVYVFT